MTKLLKKEKYLDIIWLKNKGAQDKVLEEKNESNIIIKCVTNKYGHMWTCIKPDYLLTKNVSNAMIVKVGEYNRQLSF